MPGATSGTCVITGASSGVGLEAARQLAAAGLKVVGVGRAPETCRRAEEEIRKSCPGADVRITAADLSSMGCVRRAAAGIRDGLPGGRLERLIHAAATISKGYAGTEDGYELQFAVNYLAAFLMTRELFPALIRPGEARVITVSSGAHRRTEMAWDDPMLRRRYSGLRAYRQSKLALVLFTMELNRRAAYRFPLRAIGVELGPVGAEDGEANKGLGAADAATAIVRLAADPLSSITSDYWRLGRPIEPGPYARNPEAARRLWRLSEELCGVDFLGPGLQGPSGIN
ncbi:MAG: SDR family NAD(P)-dependent oxidoreductase [Candidatus Aminicenantes bacterium]|nr:MAG: SDR family NAD(P)-dependent oxidoreductase [Candidatus Aminicenantes bacterium]